MTRKEKMALKRKVHQHIQGAVQDVSNEQRTIEDFVEFHQRKDRIINKVATAIVIELVKAIPTSKV